MRKRGGGAGGKASIGGRAEWATREGAGVQSRGPAEAARARGTDRAARPAAGRASRPGSGLGREAGPRAAGICPDAAGALAQSAAEGAPSLPSLRRIVLAAVLATLLLRGLVLLSAPTYIEAPEDECIYGTVALERLSRPGLDPYDLVWPYKGGGVLTIFALGPLVALLGPHAWTVKSFSLIVSCVIVALAAVLLDRCAGRGAALVGCALLVLAPPHLVFRSLMTVGDHYLARPFDLAVVALAAGLLSRERPSPRALLLLGAAAGLAGWVCYDTAPTSLACLALAAVRWRRLAPRELAASLALAAAGALLGLVPWLAYNASHGFDGLRILGGNSPAPGATAASPAEKLWSLVAKDLRESFDFQYLPRRGPLGREEWDALSWLYLAGLAAGWLAAVRRWAGGRATPLERILVAAPLVHALAYTLGPFVIDDKGLRSARYLLGMYHPLMLLAAIAAARWWSGGRRGAASVLALSLLVPGALANLALVEPSRWVLVGPARWPPDLDREYPPVCWDRMAWFIGWRYRSDPARLDAQCALTMGGLPERRFCWWGAGYGAGWEGGPDSLGRLPCPLATGRSERARCLAGALEAVRERWTASLGASGLHALCTERAADGQACAEAVGAGMAWRGDGDERCAALPSDAWASCERGGLLMGGQGRPPSRTAALPEAHAGQVTALRTGSAPGGGPGALATGGSDGTLRSFALSDLSPLASAANPGGTFYALLSNGTHLFAGSHDGTISAWSLPDLHPLGSWQAHREIVFGLAWNGTALVSASHDGVLKSWNASTRERLAVANPGQGALTSLAVASGLTVAGGFNGRVVSWDGASAPRAYTGHEGSVLSVWTDGRLVYTGSMDHAIKVWRADGGRLWYVRDLAGHTSGVSALAGDAELLASAGIDGRVLAWDRGTGEAVLDRAAGGSVYSVALSPGRLFVGLGNGTVLAWPRPEAS